MHIAKRTEQFHPSPTMALDAKAKELKAKGHPVISFGVGEPDFDTPDAIKNAAKAALDAGFTKYTPASGLPSLKEAIIRKLQRDSGLTYTPDQVLVSVGAKHSLFNLMYALVDPGDEVIIPSPYWVTYPDQVELAGGRPVIVPGRAELDLKITAQDLEGALSPKTKAFIFNSPSNPTGAVYTPSEIRALTEVCVRHGVVIVSDEVYEKLIYGSAEQFSPAQVSREAKEWTVVVNSVSKTYAMTGWRVGYIASDNRELVRVINALQSQVTSNVPTVSQKAAEFALGLPDEALAPMVATFARRRDLIVDRLRKIPGVEVPEPQGAFYVFPNVRGLLGKRYGGGQVDTVEQLAERLLEEKFVAMVPGAGFGFPEHVRLSYATSEENINEGLSRMEDFLNS